MNANRDALGQAHPREYRVDGGNSLIVGLCIRNIDRASDAVDMAAHDLTIAHQLYFGRVAHADGSEGGFFKISIDPIRAGVDKRDGVDADINVVAKLSQQIRDVAVDRGENARARDPPEPGEVSPDFARASPRR